jgi:hypothetical protein
VKVEKQLNLRDAGSNLVRMRAYMFHPAKRAVSGMISPHYTNVLFNEVFLHHAHFTAL